MAKTCAQCNTEYKGDTCPTCTETGVDIGKVLESEKEQMDKNESASVPTAFLVDLVSNRKIPITTPRCRVGRDDLNDIVISGDQSISRFHFIITYEDSQYYVQDAKSRHGTFLNGNQISGPEAINDGDVLKIGVSLFWFVIESAQGGSEESLQPVDVEKIASEELSLKKGSNIAAMSEAELTATMEIDLPTAESLAAAEAKVMEAAEAAKSSKGDEEAKEDEAEPVESKEEDSEPESKADSKSESKSQEDDDKAEEQEEEKEEAAKSADDSDDKAEPESEKKDDAPAEDESKSSKVTSESDIEMTVKDLLEPLQDELEASRAMIKDALKKGNLKDEEPAESESEDAEPESKKDEEEESKEPEAEEKPESKDDDEKGAEPVSEDEPAGAEEKEPEDKKSEEDDSKADSLSVSGLDVEPTDIEVSGLDEEKNDEPESKDDEPESTEEVSKDGDSESEDEKPESKDDEEPESTKESEEKAEPADKSEDEADSSTKDKTTKGKSAEAETLEKIAEIIDDSSSKQEAEPEPEASRESADSEKESGSRDDDGKTTHAEPATMETANGAEEEITIMGPTSVPDWCKKYFSDELKSLTKELDSLNEQIKQTQDRIRKIEGKAALTKGLRNTLLTADGDDLIEACVKVLGLAGWEVTQSEDDKNELVLAHGDEQVAIARIIWTKDKAERSHLGQLSISQTRYWCENGVEPKGILILSKLSDKAPTDRANEADPDLVTYAQQKNVCLMDTVQLLALYRDLALKDGKTDEKRGKIQDGKGWLSGFELEPGDEMDDEGEKETTKGKSLSSLLSA